MPPPFDATPDRQSSPRDDALIAARRLHVRRGGRPILEHVDIRVAPGEIVTIVGPNGAGKTTLLKTLLGLIAPDAGWIRATRGLRVAYVPQRLPIDATLPLAVRRFLTLTGPAPRAAVAAALAETGTAHLDGRDLRSLSGGELQRVMLARALVRAPQLLLLDEPLQGVDFAGEADLYRLIGEIRSRLGCGVLLVSHDLDLVFAQADRVVCLNRRVCCTGSPDAIRTHPEYVRLFGPRATERPGTAAPSHAG